MSRGQSAEKTARESLLTKLRKPEIRIGGGGLLAALVPVVLVCLVMRPVYPMCPDEFVQQLYASGKFFAAGPSLLMPYSLVLVSAPLGVLYSVLPQVPWYALLLLALTVASYWAAYDEALRSRMSANSCIATLAILFASEVICTLYLTYTIVAFLACAAGLMLVMRRAAFDGPKPVGASDVLGLALVALGYSLRPESGLATIVVFAPFALWVLVKNCNIASIVRGALVLTLAGVCAFAGRFAYDHTPGWEGYASYLDAGRNVLDYPDMSVEQVQALAPELSENDVAVLQSWLFADDSVYGTELFERLAPGSDHLGLSNISDSLRAKTTYLLVGLVVVVGAYGALLHRGRGGRGGERVLVAGIVLMLAASCALLILRARVRLHVVIPLIVIAVFALLSTVGEGEGQPVVGRHAAARPQRSAAASRLVVAVSALLAVGVCGAFWYTSIRPLDTRGSAQTAEAARAYVADHPTELVVFGRTQTVMFRGLTAFGLESWEYPQNMMQVGGWENHTAPWAAQLERWGIEGNDLLQQLPEKQNMVAVLNPTNMELIRAYLSEHSGREVAADVVEDLGPSTADPSVDLCVYRFSYAS